MSSLSKCKKRFNGLDVGQCEDRVTNLPASLITRILSCLPIDDAVVTSVLSKKWKRLWTFVTNLDFDDSKLTTYHNVNSDTESFKKFTSFVTRVLLLCDRSGLQRIRMKCSHGYDDSLVNAWLISVMQCHVQELDISIQIKDHGLLPSDILICRTLVVLKLNVIGSYMNISKSACLPCLQTLHVDGVQFSNDVSITNLLSGCPVLEELSLRECVGQDVHVVNIVSPALKSLIIGYLPCDYWKESNTVSVPNYRIMIDTPALEYFCFDDHRFIAHVYLVNNMNHLIKADITFDRVCLNQFHEVHSKAIEDFLNRISQVRNLVLSWDSLEVISTCKPVLPKFSCLTYLELNTALESAWIVLPKILKNSPCLETLYLLQGDEEIEKSNLDISPFDEVPSCFLFNLKKIEIEHFEHSEGELEVVEYILKNAKILKKLTLHYVDNDAEFFKELLSLPRASTICKVVIK